MSKKIVIVADLGEVSIYKRKGSTKISLKVAGDKVKVTQPYWLPYSAGMNFAKQNVSWVKTQFANAKVHFLENGQAIGKNHTIYFYAAGGNRTLVKNNNVDIYFDESKYDFRSPHVQNLAKKAIKRALLKEANTYIPDRLKLLSQNFDFEYNSLLIKPMKSRWGSCSADQVIKINCYLMLMPWEVIDYVLLHELTHTKHLHHGPDFWRAVETFMPDYKKRKKMLKELQPTAAFAQI